MARLKVLPCVKCGNLILTGKRDKEVLCINCLLESGIKCAFLEEIRDMGKKTRRVRCGE